MVHARSLTLLLYRMVQYYDRYRVFMNNYPRFFYCPATFNGLRTTIGKVEKWFESEDCQRLPADDMTSEAYWKNEDVENHTMETIMDF